MKTEEGLLAAAGGLVAGSLLGSLVLAPASLRRALYATGDGNKIRRVEGTLKNNDISYNVTGPAIDKKTVTVVDETGKAMATVYVVVVSQTDFEKARSLIGTAIGE
jgi:hypothetical protein